MQRCGRVSTEGCNGGKANFPVGAPLDGSLLDPRQFGFGRAGSFFFNSVLVPAVSTLNGRCVVEGDEDGIRHHHRDETLKPKRSRMAVL
jgi:hypothetical protein